MLQNIFGVVWTGTGASLVLISELLAQTPKKADLGSDLLNPSHPGWNSPNWVLAVCFALACYTIYKQAIYISKKNDKAELLVSESHVDRALMLAAVEKNTKAIEKNTEASAEVVRSRLVCYNNRNFIRALRVSGEISAETALKMYEEPHGEGMQAAGSGGLCWMPGCQQQQQAKGSGA